MSLHDNPEVVPAPNGAMLWEEAVRLYCDDLLAGLTRPDHPVVPPVGEAFRGVVFQGPEDRRRCHRFLREVMAIIREDEERERCHRFSEGLAAVLNEMPEPLSTA